MIDAMNLLIIMIKTTRSTVCSIETKASTMASLNIPPKRSRRIAEKLSLFQHREERSMRSNSNNNYNVDDDHEEVVEAAIRSSTTAEQMTSHGKDAASGGGALVMNRFRTQHDDNEPTATNNMNFVTSSTVAMSSSAGVGALVMNRFHTPHPHDVLSGRGGAINSHEGNVQFRQWVQEQRTRYALAKSKQEKTLVAQLVIDIVRAQQPPGRFLQKDHASRLGSRSAGEEWWVELDEDKVMAKTCQALREGATQIRAAYGLVVDEQRTSSGRRKSHKPAASPIQELYSPAISTAALTLVSSAAPTTAKNSSNNSPAIALSGQKRMHPGSQNIPPPQHQHQEQQQNILKVAFLSSPEEMNRQAAISQLRVNVEEAKQRYHDPMQAEDDDTKKLPASNQLAPTAATGENLSRITSTSTGPGSSATAAPPPASWFRSVDWFRSTNSAAGILPTDDATPPLMAAEVVKHKLNVLPPLTLSHDSHDAAATAAITDAMTSKRHSLSFSLSDGASPTDDWATSDFVNPFEQDDSTPPDALNTNHDHDHHHHHRAAILHHPHLPVGTVDSSSSLWHRRPRHGVPHEVESRTDHRHQHHASIRHQPLPVGTVDASLSPWPQRPGVYHEEQARIGATTSSDEDDLVALGALLQAPTPPPTPAVPGVQAAPTPPNTATEASSVSTQPQSAAAAVTAVDTTYGRACSNLSSRYVKHSDRVADCYRMFVVVARDYLEDLSSSLVAQLISSSHTLGLLLPC
jgi:hypothetical protein